MVQLGWRIVTLEGPVRSARGAGSKRQGCGLDFSGFRLEALEALGAPVGDLRVSDA